MPRSNYFRGPFLFFVWLGRWTAFRTTTTVFLRRLISPFTSATILLLFLSLNAQLTRGSRFLVLGEMSLSSLSVSSFSVLDASSVSAVNSKRFQQYRGAASGKFPVYLHNINDEISHQFLWQQLIDSIVQAVPAHFVAALQVLLQMYSNSFCCMLYVACKTLQCCMFYVLCFIAVVIRVLVLSSRA